MNEVTTPKRAWLTKSGFAWVATPAQAKVDAFSSALPAGTIVVSKIHKTEHPYIVSKGHVAVWIEGQGVVQIRAPHCGITKPGTRRVLYIRAMGLTAAGAAGWNPYLSSTAQVLPTGADLTPGSYQGDIPGGGTIGATAGIA